MHVLMRWSLVLGAGCLGACARGQGPSPRVAADVRSEADPAAVESSDRSGRAPVSERRALEPTTDIPTSCRDPEACFPPEPFVRALCLGKFPALALHLFRHDAPWQHVYVQIPEVMPVNAYGGPVTHAPLMFSEEVILLRHRPFHPIRGYDVDSPDKYDVLRLSGSCAELAEDELRRTWRGPSEYAPIVWAWLEPGLRQALSRRSSIEAARREQQTSCGGRYMGGGNRTCQQATSLLSHAIMREVDDGLDLPAPGTLPEWVPPG